MTDLARLEIERHEQCLIARLKGEIDASNADPLQRAIVAAISKTTAGLVLDLSGVEYMDSSGIRMLFLLHDQLKQRGQHMRAVVPETTPIKGILDCLGVGTLIQLDSVLSDALAH
jgi:stage II sporulation protein AA (anti-sigma F factor antagonist)